MVLGGPILSVLILFGGSYLGLMLINIRLERDLREEKSGQEISIGDEKFNVDVADDADKLVLGLSGRASLEPFDGMLFVFDEMDTHGIWMKDMHFPIDILWLDEDARVIYIVESADPSSFPSVFEPPHPAKYVLEVSSGFVGEEGVSIGTVVEF
jgi:uncharacterized membrane protein (UPF0127 family)